MPTIHEVAERAGVSTATVSCVINQSRFVSTELTERVLKAVSDLHFTPSRVAQSLRQGKTSILGLVMVPELEVADNLFLGKELYRRWLGLDLVLDRRAMRERSRGLLRELGINIPAVTEKVKHLSGGQQQSVSIAHTVFFDARLVILDEPTSSISINETRKVLDLILELKRKGVSSIIVSHRMDDIFSTADRIVVLRRGHKIEDVRKEDTSMEEIIKKIVHAEKESMRQES